MALILFWRPRGLFPLAEHIEAAMTAGQINDSDARDRRRLRRHSG